MSETALVFAASDQIGRVVSVDTSRVLINVSDSVLLTSIGVGQLLAIKGTTQQEFLIAITEKVTRTLGLELSPEAETGDDESLSTVPRDLMRAALVGTFRSVEGEKKNTFKRGADSFPQIDRDCYVISGSNLQRFMGILGQEIPEDERLLLGRFVADRSAVAIANGDKFFQRHAAILGSTGSGKSWAVALILERASKLKFPNIIVMDMHGEYAPLADKDKGGFAKRYRIAGPGDLDKPKDDVLFLPYWLLNRDEMLSMILDRSDQNAPNQASRFTSHVRQLKQDFLDSVKKLEVKKTFTVDSPIPYQMKDLLSRLGADNTAKGVSSSTGKPITGDLENKLTRFISRLEAKLEDRRYGFMFTPSIDALNYDWLSQQLVKLLGTSDGAGIKIIDFSEVPSDVFARGDRHLCQTALRRSILDEGR